MIVRMKDKIIYIKYKEKDYPLAFTLNVMEALQEKYGSIDEWASKIDNKDGKEPNIKDIKYSLWLMINEGIEMQNEDNDEKMETVDLNKVGRIITAFGLSNTSENIKNLIIDSTKVDSTKNV